MIKKLIKFSTGFSAFSTALISNINMAVSVNEIYYSDAVKRVNDVRSKIDVAIEDLTTIVIGIDKYRDLLNDNNDSTNYQYYNGVKSYIFYKSVSHGSKHESYGPRTSCAKACIYRLFNEEIVLNPYYVNGIIATCYYVITSWAGNSWETMGKWFTDSSVTKHQIYKSYSDIYYISNLNEDKKEMNLTGIIDIEKPNASIYMTVEIESSEKSSPLLKKREYMTGHTGWAVFDWYLLKGNIVYNITEESKAKLQKLKATIANLKSAIKSEMEKLNSYDPNSDRNNSEYNNSNLKQILNNCEQAYNRANDFINLRHSNGWTQKF